MFPRCAPKNVELITPLIGGSHDPNIGAHILRLSQTQTFLTFWQNSQYFRPKELRTRVRIIIKYFINYS